MRVEHESGMWVELVERWTYGDQLAVRREARRGDDFDPEAATLAVMVRCVRAWSLDVPVSGEAIEALDAEVGVWLNERCREATTSEAPKVSMSSPSSMEAEAAS